LKTQKLGKKGKKTTVVTIEPKEGGVGIDFEFIKKFTNLKLTLPLSLEDFEKTLDDLEKLKDALVYWGKILQRQNKVKYIRNSRKLSNIEEYKQMVEDEL